MKLCKMCGAPLTGKQRRFCSTKCKNKNFYSNYVGKPAESIKTYRPKLDNCEVCGKPLRGKQTRFCSIDCKNASHQDYAAQFRRGLKRKLELVRLMGGECMVCGYKKNLAALSFHHQNEEEKVHKLDMRSLSNRTLEAVMTEFEKCQLLCANCHMELHYPHFDMDTIDLEAI